MNQETFERPPIERKSSKKLEIYGSKLSDYRIMAELGRGSYGIVYKVEYTKNNEIFVLKKINMKHMKSKHQKEAWREVQILSRLDHPHIIQ